MKFTKRKLFYFGCSEKLAKILSGLGFEKIITGKEAVLKTGNDHFSKKSLKLLIKRGMKKGYIFEANLNAESLLRLNELKKNTVHGKKPQLKNLFLSEFNNDTRLFVFCDKQSNWLGAILTGSNNHITIETELLLRRESAPVGVMESLIYFIFKTAQKEGYNEFSLGEVPFINSVNSPQNSYKEKTINFFGRVFSYAYNYKGLYNFKNKFNPIWIEKSMCGNPGISYAQIAVLFIKTNLLKLAVYKLFN